MFLEVHYDNVYRFLKKNNRVMELKEVVKLTLMPKIEFQKYMPRRYRNKMILFDLNGKEYIFIPTKEMIKKNEKTVPA